MKEFTLCLSYYRQPTMLRRQIEAWENYPPEVKVLLCDDASPEPAWEVLREFASPELLRTRVHLYQIEVDIPWNREQARNVCMHHCETDWALVADLDHVLPVESAVNLLPFEPEPETWYRFRRFRVGAADETRAKDASNADFPISPECEFGEIKPHVDSYLITKALYRRSGGYDEDYSGFLGGGNPFLKRLSAISTPKMAPEDVSLHVYTRSVVADASDWSLSRDRQRFKQLERWKIHTGNTEPQNSRRQPYHWVDLC